MRFWTLLLVSGLAALAVASEPLKRRKQQHRIQTQSENGTRRVRSRLAKSCGGEVSSSLLEEWYLHSDMVFTAAVDEVDREKGKLNVTLRRVIRISSNGSEMNSLDSQEKFKTGNPLILYGLFDARAHSCVPQFRIRTHDVLLFLVRRTDPANTGGPFFRLVSAPLRITLRNLRLIHTSPTGMCL